MKEVRLTLFFLTVSFFPDLLIFIIEEIFNYEIVLSNELLKGKSAFEMFFLSVLIGPFLETLFYQTLFFRILNNDFLKKNKIRIILLSAFVFGISHFFSFFYMLYAFCGGLLLSWFYYIVLKNSNDHQKATFLTFLFHSIRNFIVFVIVCYT